MSSFAQEPSSPPLQEGIRECCKKYYRPDYYETITPFPTSLSYPLVEIRTSKHFVKCYSLSDIHADTDKNQQWIDNHGQQLVEQDQLHPDLRADLFRILLIPGDVGSEVDKIDRVLESLHTHYDLISYLPGNHEAWLRGDKYKKENLAEDGNPWDSVKKLQEIYNSLGKFANVLFGPVKVTFPAHGQEGGSRHLLIQPLHAWYHKSWDTEPDITHPLYLQAEANMPFTKKWGDYSMCRWPIEYCIGDSKECSPVLAEAFALFNEDHLRPLAALPDTESDIRIGSKYISAVESDASTIISFSHFLPRQELCPEKRFLIEPKLSTVIGSDILESQVRRLCPNLHLYGHTHVPMDVTLEGIRYVQWPLGYFREADKQCFPIFSSGPLLVFDSQLGDGDKGIPQDMVSLSVHWTEHYRQNPRTPDIVDELAPWVIERLSMYAKPT